MTNKNDTPANFDILIVGGLGHVGLPLGLLLADKQYTVALWDINEAHRQSVLAGKMPFVEHDAEPVLRRVLGKQLFVAESIDAVSRSDVVIVTVGTPLDDANEPSMAPILALVEQLAPYLNDEQLLMLRSTVYPGTTRQVCGYLAKRKLGTDVTFCPERILQGYALREYNTLAQIVSGNSDSAVQRAREIFERLEIRTVEVSLLEAELAKLFTNAWRYLQFAIANQFYSVAVDNNVDFDNIYRAITHGYERARDMPRPGFAAGPCLYKDTLQLAAFCGEQFPMGVQAAFINQGMPEVIIKQIEQRGVQIAGCRIGILGMAFKAEVDDLRDSLSVRLRQILEKRGAAVLCADEYAKSEEFVSPRELLAHSEVVIVGAPHSAYKQLDLASHPCVIDPWSMLAGQGS